MFLWIMGFVLAFGLLIVVPLVAIITENARKRPLPPPPTQVSPELQRRLERMEAIVAAQQKQIEDLKELVHVNIIKLEDFGGLQQRIGPPGE